MYDYYVFTMSFITTMYSTAIGRESTALLQQKSVKILSEK